MEAQRRMAAEREREAGSLPQCLAQLLPQAQPGRRLRALLALRCKHVKEPGGAERFRRAGGLRALLGLLGREGVAGRDRKELELVLSILANCCTEERARREMGKLGAIPPLVAILKGFSVASVQNRAARALGNLALEGENSVAIHESGAVPHLIHLLSGTEDAECLQSAVRAVRILCDTPAHRRALTSQGCVAPLVGLLGREEPGLLGAAARAAAELTRSCGAPCAQQLSRHGGIARLAALAGHGKRAVREGALAALGNLCGQGFVRPSVGGAGGVGLLAEALRAESGSPSAPAHLRALCLCCREAVNRARVREAGGLELLLALLKEPGHRVSHPRIIAAFVGFFYDQAALDYLHTRGLIPVLVAKLVAVAKLQREPLPPGTALPHHRHPPQPDEPDDERQAASFDFPSDCDHRIDGELQPEASSSFLSLRSWLVSEGYIDSPGEVPSGRCAPCGGGEMESSFRLMQCPGERAEEEEDLVLAEQPGEASESGGGGGAASGSRSGLALTLPSDPLPSPTTPAGPSPSPEPCGPEAPILLLLSRFSQAEDPAPGLLSERSLRGLLDYLTLVRLPSPRCARLLARLACNPNCLEALVRARAVPLVRAQLVHGLGPGALLDGTESAGRGAGARISGALTPCGIGTTRRNRELGEVLLRNLSVQAESPFGMGALTHLLLSGSESEKTACAIALPLLCRNESLRRKLLVDHGGLHLLLETLLTGEPVVTFGAADAMATMAGAAGPEPARKRPWAEEGAVAGVEEERGADPPRCLFRELVRRGATDMHFVLDGGERLAAVRGHVSRGSEVFGAMLAGGYLESRQSEVPLRGLAPDVCSLFLHHLHGCQTSAGCPVLARLEEEQEEAESPFEASLLGRALAAAGQYLLSDLGARLEEAICGRRAPAQLPALYHFAERHHCPGLRARCLRGLLEAPMDAQERAGAWGRLAEGAGDPVALLSALHTLLLEHV